MRWILAALASIPLGAISPIALGSEGSLPEIVGVRVGMCGQYKAGLWTPVEVLLRGGSEPWSGQVAAITPDGDGMPCRFFSPTDPTCSVQPGDSKSISLFVKFGRTEPSLTVQLFQSEGAVQVHREFKATAVELPSVFPRALRSTEGLIVVVGPETLAIEETLAGVRQPAGGRVVAVRLSDAAQLPSHWCGFESADMVVLATSDAKAYAGLKAGSPPVVALEQWVRMGGSLLLCAGRNAESLVGAGGPLAGFAPGKLVRTIPLRNTNAIETYCGGAAQIPREGFAKQTALRAPQWSEVEGVVEAREGNLPLIVRRSLGFGSVVFVGLDLDLPPLAAWSDRGQLWGKLLGEIGRASCRERV